MYEKEKERSEQLENNNNLLREKIKEMGGKAPTDDQLEKEFLQLDGQSALFTQRYLDKAFEMKSENDEGVVSMDAYLILKEEMDRLKKQMQADMESLQTQNTMIVTLTETTKLCEDRMTQALTEKDKL